MNRTEILEKANACVTGKREEEYGCPEDNFALIAEFWEAYLEKACVSPGADVCVNAEDVAAMMGLLKIARLAADCTKEDSWIDLAGYAACGGEIACRGE